MAAVSKRTARRVLSDLGRRVAELRENRGLTQEQLSELLSQREFGKWSTRQVQRVEAGAANMALKKLLLLAEVLSVDPIELLTPPLNSQRPGPGRPPGS
jgi:transcriptional regulator with XRE-family HTH domain